MIKAEALKRENNTTPTKQIKFYKSIKNVKNISEVENNGSKLCFCYLEKAKCSYTVVEFVWLGRHRRNSGELYQVVKKGEKKKID